MGGSIETQWERVGLRLGRREAAVFGETRLHDPEKRAANYRQYLLETVTPTLMPKDMGRFCLISISMLFHHRQHNNTDNDGYNYDHSVIVLLYVNICCAASSFKR